MKPTRTTAAILFAAVVCISGCKSCRGSKSSDPPKPAPTTTQLQGESTVLPRGPDEAKATEPKVTTTAKAVGPINQRRYVLVAPVNPKPGPLPLVLVIHGDGGSAKSFADEWHFEKATQNDAYLAYLDGRQATWDLETLKDNVDIKYVEWVIDDVAATVPIDKTHVFAAGYSSGGFFANVLACHRPGLLRGIASNAGGAPFNQAETWPNGYPKCPGQAPVATLVLHGDKDGTVGLDSGRFDAEYWAYINGCNESQLETTGYAECRAYKTCKPEKAVGYCVIPGLNHWVWDQSAVASWTFFQHL